MPFRSLCHRGERNDAGRVASANLTPGRNRQSSPLNAADDQVGQLLRWFTFMGHEEIEALEAQHKTAPQERAAQRALADAVRDLARAGLSAEPGSRYAYSGLGYMVAGRVAEVAGEAEFAGSLARRLLLPIGAGEAGFLAEQSAGRRARLPVFYEWKDGVLSPAAAAGRDAPITRDSG